MGSGWWGWCGRGWEACAMEADALFQVAREDWEWEPLGEVCRRGGGDIQTGPFGSQLHASDYVAVGVPSIMPRNISQDRVDVGGIARITPSDAERLSRYLVKPGDIVYSRRGDVERRALITERESGWLCGTGCLRVRLGEGIVDPAYASYFLSHPASRDWVVRHAVGATMPNLNTSILGALPFLLPPTAEQHAIAGVLGALDDKIEQNRRTARALERLAQAIFRAWFVDFEPVKAKAGGAASFPSMPKPVFDALPNRFVDSEIDPVPEGWELKPISTIATFLNGLALQKYPPRSDGEDLRIIKIAQLRKGSAEGASWSNSDVAEQYVIGDRDLLFSWSGTLEAKFWYGGKGALNQHLFKVTSSHFPSWFCFLWIRQHLPWFRAIAASKATTMGHIKRGHLQETPVVVPPNEVLHDANEVIGRIYDLFSQLMIESRKLAAMRDVLLPELLSGEVRVRMDGGADSES